LILSNPSYKYDTTYGLTRAGRLQMNAVAKAIEVEYDGAPRYGDAG
jgi:hypothetical protein